MRLLPRSPWIRHLLSVTAALWAMWLLFRFRVLGSSLFAYLPWIGFAVVVLNVLLLLNRFFSFSSEDGAIGETLKRLDLGARLLVIAFAYWAIFLAINAGLDRSPRVLHSAQIVAIGGRTLSVGVPLVYSWASVRGATLQEGKEQRVILGPQEQRKFWNGEAVLLGIGSGRFGVPWVASMERDQELYCRQVLELAPNATQPWKDLVHFLLDTGRWTEAADESRRYMEAHPEDDDFAYYAGENLNLRGLDAEAVPFLARAVTLKPSRFYFYRLAWALTREGGSDRAIETLTAASDRYPEAWEFPFLLGYHYAKTRQFAKAIASWERVEKLKPGVTDVSLALARLRSEKDVHEPVPEVPGGSRRPPD